MIWKTNGVWGSIAVVVLVVVIAVSLAYSCSAADLPIRTNDEELHAIISSPRTLWYDKQSIPPAYQFPEITIGGFATVHDPNYNISARKSRFGVNHFDVIRTEGVGNANNEFPWRDPAGIFTGATGFFGNATTGTVKGRKAIWLPPGKPIVYWTQLIQNNNRRVTGVVRWLFPREAKVLEVLYVPDGPDWRPFEIRQRDRLADDWTVTLYTPWQSQGDLERATGLSFGRLGVARDTLGSTHPVQHFAGSERVEVLPDIPLQSMRSAYNSSPFTRADDRWRITTASASLSAVPQFYIATTAEDEACAQCHRDVGRKADDLDFLAREWYGLVRGSDGIFSFHPFAPQSISRGGEDRAVRINQALLDTGLIAVYDKRVHTSADYQQLRPEYGR